MSNSPRCIGSKEPWCTPEGTSSVENQRLYCVAKMMPVQVEAKDQLEGCLTAPVALEHAYRLGPRVALIFRRPPFKPNEKKLCTANNRSAMSRNGFFFYRYELESTGRTSIWT